MDKSYLVAGQKTSAIWSGNFIVFHSKLGGLLVRHYALFTLVCFVLFWCCSCVYNTNETMKTLFIVSVSTTTVLDPLIKMISTPSKILCVPLVTVTI